MSRKLETQHLPTRKEFIEFWEASIERSGCFMMTFYVLWLGGGSALLLLVNPTWPLVLILVAIAYVVLFPMAFCRIQRAWYGRFLRCRGCGTAIGDDIHLIKRLTAWKDREPKWVTISRTGRCPICGEQVIEMEETTNHDIAGPSM